MSTSPENRYRHARSARKEDSEQDTSARGDEPARTRVWTLQQEIDALNSRLVEAEETLSAIRRGEVDAILVSTSTGEKVFTLKGAEHPYRVLIEQMQEGAASLLDDGTIIFCNQSFARLLGLPMEKIIGKTLQQFIFPCDGRHFSALLEHCTASRSRHEILLKGRRPEAVPVAMSINSVPADDVRVYSVVVMDLTEQKRAEAALQKVHGDLEERVKERTAELMASNLQLQKEITERARVEEALRESEEMFRTLAETSAVAILVYQDECYVYANRAAERISGYSRGDLMGMKYWELMHPDDQAMIRERGTARMQGKDVLPRYEARYRTKDGRGGSFEINASTISYNGRPAGLVTALDITDRKRSEESLREYAANLERSNDDLERFAFISSHDLQEPLRTMVTFTQLLERRYRDHLDSDADEYIRYIVTAGRRMQDLINDLLEYSRVNTKGNDLRRVDSTAMVDDVVSQLHHQIAENGTTVAYATLPMVKADATQLRQVFQNLLTNAMKFHRPGISPAICISARSQDGRVQFSVQDNGIGIEPQYFDRIFVIFQRLHGPDRYEGTGIGLALVKRIVERHGGRIWVESEAGKGSTFHFTMPAVQ